jgi:hypothetical protein
MGLMVQCLGKVLGNQGIMGKLLEVADFFPLFQTFAMF